MEILDYKHQDKYSPSKSLINSFNSSIYYYILVLLWLSKITAEEIYKEGCWDGYYQEGNFWKPWNTLCKTWV